MKMKVGGWPDTYSLIADNNCVLRYLRQNTVPAVTLPLSASR